MSENYFRLAWTCVFLSCGAGHGLAAEIVLPMGSAPAPIASRHFPDRVHEFVWRNWNAVAPSKLAKILGASAEEVAALAESMGLPPATAIPPEMKTRGYITLIRRNWHLLPYDQLLTLLGWDAQRLAYTLKEDDFLSEAFYKMLKHQIHRLAVVDDQDTVLTIPDQRADVSPNESR